MKIIVKIMLVMLVASVLFLSTGCETVGVKKEVSVVYASPFRPPDANGALKIATNEPIPVTIEGDSDTYAEMDLGGMYAIPASELELFLNALEEYNNAK